MFDNTFQKKNHGFYGIHFKIEHNDQVLEKSSIGNLIVTSGMYPNQMAPLMETLVQKRRCCHKLYAKKWIFFTILKNCICDISTIFKRALRGGMLLQNYIFFTILSPHIYDLMDRKN